MKLRKVPKHGRQVWRVHFRDTASGNRRPYSVRFFQSKTTAEAWIAQRQNEQASLGSAWMAMPAAMRQEVIEAYQLASQSGVSITEAVRAARVSAAHPRPLSSLIEEVLGAKRAKGLRERSLSALEGTLRAFERANPGVQVDQVDSAMVVAFLGSREWGARRRRGVLTDLGTMFNHAVRIGAITRSPVAAVEKPMVEAKATPVLTPDQAEQLFRTVESREPELIGFLALAAFGGFRTESEVERMKRADVVAALRTGSIAPPVENKTRRRRVVPILPCLRAWLDSWFPLGVEVVPVNFGKRWKRVRRAAGLNPWPQNVLRHSRASYRLAQTGDETLTAAEDGHSAAMLHRHYRALVTKEDAERYFGIMPTPGLNLRALANAERERQREAQLAGLKCRVTPPSPDPGTRSPAE